MKNYLGKTAGALTLGLAGLAMACNGGNANNTNVTSTDTPTKASVMQKYTPEATPTQYVLPADCVKTQEPLSLRDADAYIVSMNTEQSLTEVPYQDFKFRRVGYS